MNSLPYILQVQGCIAVFWLVYRFFMRGSRAFGHNRMYLLGTMALAFVIPALSIPVWPVEPTAAGTFDLGAFEMFVVETQPLPQKGIGWQDIIAWIYAAGVAVIAIGAGRQVWKMTRTLRRGLIVRSGTARIVSHESVRSPYSFFDSIFINPAANDADARARIVAHEMAHVRLRHSYDAVFAQLLLTVFWWNPFVWLWSRSLREIHEYQADAAVLKLGFDSKQYITLLVETLAGLHPGMVSGFSYSLLKNRLIMMTKPVNNRPSKWRILAVVPAAAALMGLFSLTEKAAAQPPADRSISVTAQLLTPPAAADEPLELHGTVTFDKDNADEPFVFSGTVTFGDTQEPPAVDDRSFSAFAQLVTPVAADVPPRVQADPPTTVEDVVVAGYGEQQKANVVDVITVKKEADKVLEDVVVVGYGQQRKAEVVGALTANPLPNVITLDEDPESKIITIRSAFPWSDANPLMLVDGVESPIAGVDIDKVKNISVLKDKSATEVFGEKGKNGVILITTKPNANKKVDEVVVVGYGTQRKDSSSGTKQTQAVVRSLRIIDSLDEPGSPGPLIVLDGEKMPADFDLKSLGTDKIESLSMLQGEYATTVYGEAGENGVILIETKK